MAERTATETGDGSITENTPEGLERRNQLLRNRFSSVIDEAKGYNKIRSSMQRDVRELVGIRDGSTGSGGPRPTSGSTDTSSATATDTSGDGTSGGGTSGDSASDDTTLHIEHSVVHGGRRPPVDIDIADGYETPPTPPPSGDSTSADDTSSDDASPTPPPESDIY